MRGAVAARPAPLARVRDLVALGKPRLSGLVIFTAAMGLAVAPEVPDLTRALAFLAATSCLVAAANALNCWLEREIDGLMWRTRSRPLPAGRLEPWLALAFGLVLGVVSLSVLLWSTNRLTAGLGALALVSYVLVYTPLKRMTPWALPVGAIPGALPPLMGFTAATGHVGAAGLFLFGILFFWQLPHFVAISLYLLDDFRRGGIRVLPAAHGVVVARRWLLGFSVLLALFSLAALPLGLAGAWYTGAALLSGAGFVTLALRGLRADDFARAARTIFGATLLHLPLLLVLLVLDR